MNERRLCRPSGRKEGTNFRQVKVMQLRRPLHGSNRRKFICVSLTDKKKKKIGIRLCVTHAKADAYNN